MDCVRRRSNSRSTRVVLAGVGAWIVLSGLAAPVDQAQHRIAALEDTLDRLERQEYALMTRQDELSGVIKQLKTESRNHTGPFAARRLETSLGELRALLVDRADIERQEAETVRALEVARARLRSAIRDEVTRYVGRPSPDDQTVRQTLKALLDAYPTAPSVPPLPPVHEWQPIPLSAGPDLVAEQVTLLRDERERHDVALRQVELIHELLEEELAVCEMVGDPESGAHIRERALDRRMEEAAAHIAASRQKLLTIDAALQELEARLPKTDQGP